MFFKCFIFFVKSMEFLISDYTFCITSLSWLSKNSKAFSVGVPQFNITGLPGTSHSLLWIFGSKYIFPKLVTFVKYSKCFSVILSS